VASALADLIQLENISEVDGDHAENDRITINFVDMHGQTSPPK